MKFNPISIERMKYKTDKVSSALAIFGLIFNILYFVVIYKKNDNFYYSYYMGISVVYNLVFMLFVFFCAEEIKTYHMLFSILLIIIGALQIYRIFYYPAKALEAQVLKKNEYESIVVFLSISALFLIFAGIVSIIKIVILKRYIKKEKQAS